MPSIFSTRLYTLPLYLLFLLPFSTASLAQNSDSNCCHCHGLHACGTPEVFPKKREGKYGYINQQQEEVIPFIYEYAAYFKHGRAVVKKEGKYGVIDKTGQTIIPFIYDAISDSGSDLLAVVQNHRVGCVNMKAEVVLPLIYDQVNCLENGLLTADYGQGDLLLDFATGEPVIPIDYDYIAHVAANLYRKDYMYSDGMALTNLQGEVLYKGLRNAKVIETIQSDDNYNSATQEFIKLESKVGDDYFYQIINSEGKALLPEPRKDSFGTINYYNGYIIIHEPNPVKNKKEIRSTDEYIYHIIDTQGNVVLTGDFDFVDPRINNNLILVKNQSNSEDKWYYYQANHQAGHNKLAFDKSFDKAEIFSDGMALVSKDKKIGFINTQGEFVVDLDIKTFGEIQKNRFLVVDKDDNFRVIDNKGKFLTAAIEDKPKYFNGDILIVENSEAIKKVYDLNRGTHFEIEGSDVELYKDFMLIKQPDNFNYRRTLVNLHTGDIIHKQVLDLQPTDDESQGGARIIEVVGYQNDKRIRQYGVLSQEGEIHLFDEPQNIYSIKRMSDDVFVVQKEDSYKFHIYNAQAQLISKEDYDDVKAVQHGYVIVEKEGLIGAIDRQGNKVIPPTYKDLKIVDDKVILAEQGMSLFNKNGKPLTPPIYNNIGYYNEELLNVDLGYLDKYTGLIDKQGNTIVPATYLAVKMLTPSLFLVVKAKNHTAKAGVVNEHNQVVIPIEYDGVKHIDAENFAVKGYNGHHGWTFINRDNQQIIKQYFNKVRRQADNRMAVRQEGKWGLVDGKGNAKSEMIYDDMVNINDTLIKVKKDAKYGIMNMEGRLLTPIEYDDIESSKDDELMVVKKDAKYGYIDQQGNLITALKYDWAELFNKNDTALVGIDHKSYEIDRTGEILRPAKYGRRAVKQRPQYEQEKRPATD